LEAKLLKMQLEGLGERKFVSSHSEV